MGCSKIWIGAESGSQKIIDTMDRRVSVDTVRETINKTKSYGIKTGTFIMVGYPNETFADIKETIKHLKIAGPDEFTITVTYPITGTDLYNSITPKKTLDWSKTTDRDIDFERNRSKKYYEYALRYIVNSVEGHKRYKNKDILGIIKSKSKTMVLRMLMAVTK